MGAEAFTPDQLAPAAMDETFFPTSRPYAILLTGHSTEYMRKVYGGLACLYQRMLSDPGETWQIFHVIDGEFPSDDELHHYEGFVITGSWHDAHSTEPWVLKLCELIRKLHREKMKLLGFCFGHQVISRALGGKTGRSGHGWEVGLRKISVLDALNAKPYASTVPASATIVEIHQDQVYELPPKADLLATSEKTSVEMYAVEDHVFCIQGHPEFPEDVVVDILDICQNERKMPEEIISQARLSCKSAKADHELFTQLCKSFLKQASSQKSNMLFSIWKERNNVVFEQGSTNHLFIWIYDKDWVLGFASTQGDEGDS